MKYFTWNPEKNEKLKKERNISFEEVVFHMQNDDEVAVISHLNQSRYPNQKVSVVVIDGYAYLVPFVESETEIFLKTIIPGRKATKKYVGENQ